MNDLGAIGRLLIVAGLALAAVGGLIWLLGRSGLPFGRLPGDLRLQGEGFSCFIPLASMLILSVLLTLALNLIIRLLGK